jgi:hypothetical protein
MADDDLTQPATLPRAARAETITARTDGSPETDSDPFLEIFLVVKSHQHLIFDPWTVPAVNSNQLISMARFCVWLSSPNAQATFFKFAASIGRTPNERHFYVVIAAP